LGLIWDGISQGRLALADAGLTLLILSRPLVLVLSGVALGASLAGATIYPDTIFYIMQSVAAATLLSLIMCLMLGVFTVGLSLRRIILLLGAPAVIARLAVVSLGAIFRPVSDHWIRTPR
jgi:hypothetical protein